MADDILIGIRSYKRAQQQLTLDLLESLGLPKERIIFSVQTREDLKAYKEAGVDKRVSRLIYRAGNCSAENINTLLDSVPQGTRLVVLDDDITAINRRVNDKKSVTMSSAQEFWGLCEIGFAAAKLYQTVAFGIYPVDNPMFMSDRIVAKSIIIGTFMGIVVGDMRFNAAYAVKEDYEFSCRVIKRYGALPRINYFAPKAKHYSAGGCEEAWKQKRRNLRLAQCLVDAYPDLLKMNAKREGEVLMRRCKKD